MERQQVDSLWNSSLALYALPGVAERCLDMQERHGADINLLLTAAWLARRGQCWSVEDIGALRALCADWRQHCLLPLRAVRRYARERVGDAPLYRRLKEAELEAERHQLAMIEDWLSMNPPAAATDVLRINLSGYLQGVLSGVSAAEVDGLAALLGGWVVAPR